MLRKEEKYLQCFQELCIPIGSQTNEKKKIMEEFRDTMKTANSHEEIITLNQSYFWWPLENDFFPGWVTLNNHTKNINLNARELAEILCCLDFVVVEFEHGKICVSKLIKKHPPYLSYDPFRTNLNAYISIRNIYSVFPLSTFSPKIEELSCTNLDFARFLNWSLRRSAIWIACRYQHGKYFHVLKWIALFL